MVRHPLAERAHRIENLLFDIVQIRLFDAMCYTRVMLLKNWRHCNFFSLLHITTRLSLTQSTPLPLAQAKAFSETHILCKNDTQNDQCSIFPSHRSVLWQLWNLDPSPHGREMRLWKPPTGHFEATFAWNKKRNTDGVSASKEWFYFLKIWTHLFGYVILHAGPGKILIINLGLSSKSLENHHNN